MSEVTMIGSCALSGQEINMSGDSKKKMHSVLPEEKIKNLLQFALKKRKDEFKERYDLFFGSRGDRWYSQFEISESLSVLLEADKPKIFVPGALGELFELKRMSFCNKSEIYISRINGNHFVVFYFFPEQKKVLFIDSLYNNIPKEMETFLKDRGYTLYVSSTKIQKDGYSCGPLASEIARMLYSNYGAVEDYLSAQGSGHKSVDLFDFLPKKELDQLRKSFSQEIGEVRAKGADYRTAQFMCALIPEEERTFTPYILDKVERSKIIIEESSQQEKQIVEEARQLFIGNPGNTKLFHQVTNELLQQENEVNKELINQIVDKLVQQKNQGVQDNSQETLKSMQKPAVSASALEVANESGIEVPVIKRCSRQYPDETLKSMQKPAVSAPALEAADAINNIKPVQVSNDTTFWSEHKITLGVAGLSAFGAVIASTLAPSVALVLAILAVAVLTVAHTRGAFEKSEGPRMENSNMSVSRVDEGLKVAYLS